jgi:peptidoglycan/xylan/chitin deacetylase (PgdA/CDA1 family)
VKLLKRALIMGASSLFYGIDWLRERALRLAGVEMPGTCTVLYYHAVPDEHRAQFERQMDDLQRIAEPTTADRTSPLETRRRYVVVTFDDAYQNITANALPALRARRIPATVFVAPGICGAMSSLADASTTSREQRRVVELRNLRGLSGTLVVIGSHSLTHPYLTRLAARDAAHELRESRRILEEAVGQPVCLFSFPYGDCNSALVSLCRDAGYSRVFTTKPRAAFADPGEFVTGRVRVDPTDWTLEFRLKASGAYRWLTTASAIKRRLLGRHASDPLQTGVWRRQHDISGID